MKNYILGISCFYHDSAAVLLVDGRIIAAVHEERFSRIKHDKRFPVNAIRFCLEKAEISISNIREIFYYENPKLKFNRILATYLNFGVKGIKSVGKDIPNWIIRKVHVKSNIRKLLKREFKCWDNTTQVIYVNHHESHACSGFFPSPYEEAAVLCIDGVGEWATTSAWYGKGNNITQLWEIKFPHSIGLLYSAITYFCGFKVDSGEYKLMGLAPYGKPIYSSIIKEKLINIESNGRYILNMEYFDFAVGNEIISKKMEKLFGGPKREPESNITQREFDLAASIQVVLEEVVYLLAKNIRELTGSQNLCMAGGVALNCVSNGKLALSNLFKSIWVQPASGDSGGALGAALYGWFKLKDRLRVPKLNTMSGCYLGSSYSNDQVKEYLDSLGAIYYKRGNIIKDAAKLIEQGNVIGWFQGRMEYGPRSLGSRSIIGDARNIQMQSMMNLKIKKRESFRPFAPAVLLEHAKDWFNIKEPSPYMLFVYQIKETRKLHTEDEEKVGIDKLKVCRSIIPAVTHIDYSARVQTVTKEENHKFYDLINEFYKLTGCPMIINTSFNVRGEPIVESIEDAYTCFMRTAMDILIIEDYILYKSEQPKWNEKINWRTQYTLD
ncbi:MAG: carbamoyltransferase [Neisseriaceae bacterium]